MLIIRLILEILIAPYTMFHQHKYIKNEGRSFETNQFKLHLYPVLMTPAAFVIRLKRIAFGQSL